MENRLTVFLQHFLPPPLLLFSFLSSVLLSSLLLSSTFSISLCFHLLFLYTLNPRQSVLTAFFCPFSLGNIHILSVPFPGLFLYASAGTSWPASSLPAPPFKQVVDSNRLGWISPLWDVLGGYCHARSSMAQFLCVWWVWQEGLA